jgi:hypothetical protein
LVEVGFQIRDRSGFRFGFFVPPFPNRFVPGDRVGQGAKERQVFGQLQHVQPYRRWHPRNVAFPFGRRVQTRPPAQIQIHVTGRQRSGLNHDFHQSQDDKRQFVHFVQPTVDVPVQHVRRGFNDTRLLAMVAFSACSIDSINTSKNCAKDVWYITLTNDISTTAKYKIDPRVATDRHCSRFSLIPARVSPASFNFNFTSPAFSFVAAKTSINSAGGKKSKKKNLFSDQSM